MKNIRLLVYDMKMLFIGRGAGIKTWWGEERAREDFC